MAKSEAATVLVSRETTLGTAPTSAWLQLQPNTGGIQGWEADLVTVERDPLSKYMSREKGGVVGINASPKLVHDLNKDLIDHFGEHAFRAACKHAGNKGQSFYRATGVTTTGYTVAALGDLTAGLLIYARGFTTSANNGAKVVGSSSTGTEIKASGLAAETPSSNATVDVIGVQGASGDIQLDASGNLIASTLDFTTLGLTVGSWIRLASSAATAAYRFGTTAYLGGIARIVTIAAGKLTLARRTWTVGSLDDGAGKTIRLYFGRFYRNVALDHADYLEPSSHGELTDNGVGTANADVYTYAKGLSLKTLEIDAPIESKMVATMSFIGTDVADPVLAASRVSGCSSAYLPTASSLVDTANGIQRARLADAADEDSEIAELNSCKITIENNIKPRKQLGTLGAAGMTFGKFEPMASFEAYFLKAESITAIRDNRDCCFDFMASNAQFGFVFDMPRVALRDGKRSYAANEPVMLSCSVPGFRDPTTNIVASLTVFPFYE